MADSALHFRPEFSLRPFIRSFDSRFLKDYRWVPANDRARNKKEEIPLELEKVELPFWMLKINALLLGIYIAGLLLIALGSRGWTDMWLKRLVGLLPNRVGDRLGGTVERFIQGMRGLNQAGAILPVFSLSFLCWFFHGMYYFLLFEALDLKLPFWAALVLQAVIAIGVIIPAGPGYVGNFEYFTVLGLSLFDTTKEEAFAYSLLAHSLQFFPVALVGLLFAFRDKFWTRVERNGLKALPSSSW